jgi:hypothetical protein
VKATVSFFFFWFDCVILLFAAAAASSVMSTTVKDASTLGASKRAVDLAMRPRPSLRLLYSLFNPSYTVYLVKPL